MGARTHCEAPFRLAIRAEKQQSCNHAENQIELEYVRMESVRVHQSLQTATARTE